MWVRLPGKTVERREARKEVAITSTALLRGITGNEDGPSLWSLVMTSGLNKFSLMVVTGQKQDYTS